MTGNGRLVPGLVSITFRGLGPEEIVRRAAACGLLAIEWGGDVHVPPGDAARARAVARCTVDAGLRVTSYGSYYHAGEGADFGGVLRSAVALGAPRIRIWAGRKEASACSAAERQAVVEDIRRVAALAAGDGIRIALEFHANTLTALASDTVAVLCELQDTRVESYWQPRVGAPVEEVLVDLAALAPWLCHAHVFHWLADHTRKPLREGRESWRAYLQALAALGREVQVQLEYVPDDEPVCLAEEASCLCEMIGALG